jgi:hypothetical protein
VSACLEDAVRCGGTCSAKDVAVDVWVAQESARVDALEHAHKVVETGVERAQLRRSQRVRLGPVRPTAVAQDDSLKMGEELAVRYREAVRPAERISDTVLGGREQQAYLYWMKPIQVDR